MISPDLDGALRAALSVPMTDPQRHALEERLRSSLEAGRPSARLRPRAIALLLVALALAAPLLFAVSAALRSTESPNGLASAAEFQAEIDAAKQVVPLPAGSTWPPYLVASDQSGSYSRGGGRAWVEFVAFCEWNRSWLDATALGDTARAVAARDRLATVVTWEFYGDEFASDSLRAVIDQVVAAVQAGEQGPVAHFVGLNCGD